MSVHQGLGERHALAGTWGARTQVGGREWARLFGCADEALTVLAAEAAEVPADDDVVLDLLIGPPPRERSHVELEADLRAGLDAAGFTRRIRRVVAMVLRPEGAPGQQRVRYFTWRPDPNDATRFAEDPLYRGLHPMRA